MSAEYQVTFQTNIEIVVTIKSDDDDAAADAAWQVAQDYLWTLGTQTGDERITSVNADLDGIGADSVEEIGADS